MDEPNHDCRAKTDPYVADRRQWPRSPCDNNEVILWTTVSEAQTAWLHDESLTGLAVMVKDASNLYPGREVRLTFTDRQKWAIVKHLHAESDGRFRVGMEWGCSEGRFIDGNED